MTTLDRPLTAAAVAVAAPDWRRALTRAGLILGALACVVAWLMLRPLYAFDLAYYWQPDLGSLYAHADLGFSNGTNYSPAFFEVTAWLRFLPWDVLVGIWRAGLLALVFALCGPWTLPMLLLLPVESEIAAGNINIVLAAAVVAGFRYPGAWAVVLLTKVTPAVGLLWFALRRDWHHLARAIGITAAIAAVSFALAPHLWAGWVGLWFGSPAPAPSPFYWPLWGRLPVAVLLVVLAGERRWPVALAAMMALPVFYTISPSMLVGVVGAWRLIDSRRTVTELDQSDRRGAPIQ
jgi:hypothetical protein